MTNIKENFLPVDLGHLEEKALGIVDCFRKYKQLNRSKEYRNYFLEQAEQISNSLLIDFGYFFDKYEIGGIIPYGLKEKNE